MRSSFSRFLHYDNPSLEEELELELELPRRTRNGKHICASLDLSRHTLHHATTLIMWGVAEIFLEKN